MLSTEVEGERLKDVPMGWEVAWETLFPPHPDLLLVVRPQLSFLFGQKRQLGGLARARTDYEGLTGKVTPYHKLWKCAHVTCKSNRKHPAKHDHDNK